MAKHGGMEMPDINVENVTKLLEMTATTLTTLSKLDPRIRAAAAVVAVASRVIRRIYSTERVEDFPAADAGIIRNYNRLLEAREKASSPIVRDSISDQLTSYATIIDNKRG